MTLQVLQSATKSTFMTTPWTVNTFDEGYDSIHIVLHPKNAFKKLQSGRTSATHW